MHRSITMPLHTLSENLYRGMNKFVKAEKTKKQRTDVGLLLRQLPRVSSAPPNRFEIVLVRISAGELDDDNLRGSLKSVRDEIAAWIGLDDKDKRIVWKYEQQKAERGTCGVRVDVHDLEDGKPRIVHLGLAHSAEKKAKKGTKTAAPNKPRPSRKPRQTGSRASASKQPPLFTVKAAAVLPWKQGGDDLVLTDLPAFENVTPPPERTNARNPQRERFTLIRQGLFRVDGLGAAWLYAPEGEAFNADEWGLERIGGS